MIPTVSRASSQDVLIGIARIELWLVADNAGHTHLLDLYSVIYDVPIALQQMD